MANLIKEIYLMFFVKPLIAFKSKQKILKKRGYSFNPTKFDYFYIKYLENKCNIYNNLILLFFIYDICFTIFIILMII